MTLHSKQDVVARRDTSLGEPRDSQLKALRLDPAHVLADANSISCEGATGNAVERCASCATLAERVKQLEQELASIALSSAAKSAVLSTTGCYWLIIGIHCVLLGFSSVVVGLVGILLYLFYPFLVGAIGSLVVCHVLANRSVLHKFARTLLSSLCVCSVTTLALSLSTGSYAELLQAQLIFVPPIFFVSWFAAKIFVWTRGWLIIPPRNDGVRLPLEIRDIFVVTFVFAVYFGVARAFVDVGTYNLYNQDSWPSIVLTVVACIPGTIAAAMIARGALVEKFRIRWLLGAYLVTTLAFIGIIIGFFALSGEWGSVSEVVGYAFYALLCSLVVIQSPMVTFLLMRLARYRFATNFSAQEDSDSRASGV